MLSREIHNNAEEVQELLSEFQNLKVDEQLSRIRGDIYASVFHDLKNSLTVIAGFGQLVSQRLGDGSSPDPDDLEFVKKHLQTINRQVSGCIELSRRYLSYLSRQPGETPRVSVNQVLADLKELIDFHPSVEGHEFQIHPLAEDALVQINGTDLIQVLLNLAVNAFQCTPEKHRVEVDARLLSQPLDLTVFKDSSQERMLNMESFDNSAPILSVSVRDNGAGISPEVLPQIFNPYFTTKSVNKGTGLGLNIVQRLVKRARGAIHVRTRVGEGTTFTVYLPASAEASPKPE
jgi:signal transduction histidine kinase